MERIRAASYVRTSTEKEAQEGSYRIQQEHFEELITSDRMLKYAGCYGDFGRSGRYADTRPGFQKMMKDCEEGNIRTIYTKSVSRFSRSVPDLAEAMEKLRALGVNVYFENENLFSDDRNRELLLHIISIMAAEESRSLGENIRLGLELRTSTGHPVGRVPYGYRRIDKDANWEIVEDEAKRIRRMFRLAGKGCRCPEIVAALNRMEEKAGSGMIWSGTRVRRTLANVAYKGDVLTGKTWRTGRVVRQNKGERPQYYLEGHHAPIVASGLFDRVQEMIAYGSLNVYQKNEKQIAGG